MYVIKEHCEDWVNRLNSRLERIEIERELLCQEERYLLVEQLAVGQLVDILRREQGGEK